VVAAWRRARGSNARAWWRSSFAAKCVSQNLSFQRRDCAHAIRRLGMCASRTAKHISRTSSSTNEAIGPSASKLSRGRNSPGVASSQRVRPCVFVLHSTRSTPRDICSRSAVPLRPAMFSNPSTVSTCLWPRASTPWSLGNRTFVEGFRAILVDRLQPSRHLRSFITVAYGRRATGRRYCLFAPACWRKLSDQPFPVLFTLRNEAVLGVFDRFRPPRRAARCLSS